MVVQLFLELALLYGRPRLKPYTPTFCHRYILSCNPKDQQTRKDLSAHILHSSWFINGTLQYLDYPSTLAITHNLSCVRQHVIHLLYSSLRNCCGLAETRSFGLCDRSIVKEEVLGWQDHAIMIGDFFILLLNIFLNWHG